MRVGLRLSRRLIQGERPRTAEEDAAASERSIEITRSHSGEFLRHAEKARGIMDDQILAFEAHCQYEMPTSALRAGAVKPDCWVHRQ
ncbi:hypothetical protein QR97_31660 [Streptomyces sp. PBH53]|nr:hypothetical protein QR97_31660 [Streptomyces sp. PBH53]